MLGLILSLPLLWLPSKGVPRRSPSAAGAPKVFNLVSKNFGDVNAREEPLFRSPQWTDASKGVKSCPKAVPAEECGLELHRQVWADFFSLHDGGAFKPVTAIGQGLKVCLMVSGLPAEFANVDHEGSDQGVANETARSTSWTCVQTHTPSF